MDELPKTCGEALDAVRRHYGIEEIRDLSVAAGISRGTLSGWKQRPGSHLNALGRDHLRRILLGQAVAHPAEPRAPSTADLAALLTEVRDLLRSLLLIEHEGRTDQLIKAKRSKKIV